jgi:sigma-B regulation protein RsbU (phosphoserine phosphatase)
VADEITVHQGRLLIIEGDPRLAGAWQQGFERERYAVRIADGDRALDVTRAFEPDVVLCDWAVGAADGLDYCRCIKADPELRATHVTLVSARADVADRVLGLDAGADDYLVKPVGTDELLARVRTGLRMRQLQRQLLQAERSALLLEVAACLGREINNPLTALLGHLELMLQNLERGDHKRLVHHIRGAGEIAERLAEVGRKLSALREPTTKPRSGGLPALGAARS